MSFSHESPGHPDAAETGEPLRGLIHPALAGGVQRTRCLSFSGVTAPVGFSGLLASVPGVQTCRARASGTAPFYRASVSLRQCSSLGARC